MGVSDHTNSSCWVSEMSLYTRAVQPLTLDHNQDGEQECFPTGLSVSRIRTLVLCMWECEMAEWMERLCFELRTSDLTSSSGRSEA